MPKFVVKGTFHSHAIATRTKKDSTETFVAGDVIFEIDNSYEKEGQIVNKVDLVPFNVFGKTAEKAMLYITGEELSITFQLEGTEYQGKNYPRIKAPFIHHIEKAAKKEENKKDVDVPF